MNSESLSDIELLKLLATDKKEKAFRILFERYHIYVLKKCQRFIKNKAEAEDVAQSVFLKLDQHYERFEKRAAFKTWLYAIAYRECLLYLRKQKKLSLRSINPEELNENYEHIDIDDAWDLETNRNLDLLNKIDPLDKALLLMKYMDGMKLKTIAEALNLGESSVKMRLKRAKARLLDLRAQQKKK